MNHNLTKKICLLTASLAWYLSPCVALANPVSLDLPEIPVALAAELESKPQYQVISSSIHPITAYTSEAAQTDDAPCITASGFNVCAHNQEDIIAANFLPLGAKVRIPELFGDRVFTVEDRMNRRFPNHVDIWMKEKKQAIQFGVKSATIEVLADF